MYCPQCGQQQVSDVTRFCSRCGFLLDGVNSILASGGVVSTSSPSGYKQLSARSKGVRQGALIMLSSLMLVPLMSIISVFLLGSPEILIPITAITCFVGGLLRILYALLMEDPGPPLNEMPVSYTPMAAQVHSAPRQVSLPPPPAGPGSWRPRPNTAEIYQPPSITENTTRLLDKDDPKTH